MRMSISEFLSCSQQQFLQISIFKNPKILLDKMSVNCDPYFQNSLTMSFFLIMLIITKNTLIKITLINSKQFLKIIRYVHLFYSYRDLKIKLFNNKVMIFFSQVKKIIFQLLKLYSYFFIANYVQHQCYHLI